MNELFLEITAETLKSEATRPLNEALNWRARQKKVKNNSQMARFVHSR